MKKKMVIFRAAGRTVRFLAARARKRSEHVRYSPYNAPKIRQRRLRTQTVPRQSSRSKQVYECLSCGKRYVNYRAAIKHRNKHREVGSGLRLV